MKKVRIKGFIIGCSSGEIYICKELLESFPPQCGKPSLIVKGLNINKLENLRHYEGYVWSDRRVVLTGNIDNNVLYVLPVK